MIRDNRRYWKLLLLTIPTFGIYNIVFWYQLTRDLNDMNTEEKKLPNYILVIFLSIITLGIYRWVWFFYVADRIQTTGIKLNVPVKPGPGTCLSLKLFGSFVLVGPFIATCLVVRNMNRVSTAYNMKLKKNIKALNKATSNKTTGSQTTGSKTTSNRTTSRQTTGSKTTGNKTTGSKASSNRTTANR